MRFLSILEKAWLAAIFIAFAMSIYNLASTGSFSYKVYTPLVCGCFCILIYMNIRGQRKFVETMKKNNADGQNGPKPPLS